HLPLTTLATKLAHRLDDSEHAVHAGVGVRQTATIGVHGEVPAGRSALSRYERSTLPFLTEAQVLQRHDGSEGEGIVEHCYVDVLVGHPSDGECLWAGDVRAGGRSKIWHLIDPTMA